jgi:tetratricopeptide (TPR) repeat protein
MSAAGQTKPTSGPTFTLIIALVTVIGGLWSLDVFLARTERQSVQSEANGLYRQGALLLQQGRPRDAMDLLRRANSMVRDNRDYQLTYVAALTGARKFDDADVNSKALLQADPNNGPANLAAARLAIQEDKIAEAESHYHRAIYGAWPDNAPSHRMAVRLELAHLLESRGEQEELLAELLALEAEAQANIPILKQVAHLFLKVGSPGRAANVYRELIARNPDDIDAYVGLGEAELAQGDYRAALSAFLEANRRTPGNLAIQRDIGLSNRISALDPTPRLLRSAEKFARSTEILQLARDALNGCAGNTDGLRRMVEDADKMLAEKAPAHVTNELAEARLTAAELMWQARIKTCGASTADQEQPLRLIMAKLAHS